MFSILLLRDLTRESICSIAFRIAVQVDEETAGTNEYYAANYYNIPYTFIPKMEETSPRKGRKNRLSVNEIK